MLFSYMGLLWEMILLELIGCSMKKMSLHGLQPNLENILKKQLIPFLKILVILQIVTLIYFPEKLIRLSKQKKSIECFNYLWDGQNNHIGRLEAIPDLVQKIADSKGNRTLLIGHSHAGQLFALITLFLEQKEKGDVLFEGLEEIISDEKRLNFIS